MNIQRPFTMHSNDFLITNDATVTLTRCAKHIGPAQFCSS